MRKSCVEVIPTGRFARSNLAKSSLRVAGLSGEARSRRYLLRVKLAAWPIGPVLLVEKRLEGVFSSEQRPPLRPLASPSPSLILVQ